MTRTNANASYAEEYDRNTLALLFFIAINAISCPMYAEAVASTLLR
jgi:hypothetical protein